LHRRVFPDRFKLKVNHHDVRRRQGSVHKLDLLVKALFLAENDFFGRVVKIRSFTHGYILLGLLSHGNSPPGVCLDDFLLSFENFCFFLLCLSQFSHFLLYLSILTFASILKLLELSSLVFFEFF
jgi:hypothetical protein